MLIKGLQPRAIILPEDTNSIFTNYYSKLTDYLSAKRNINTNWTLNQVSVSVILLDNTWLIIFQLLWKMQWGEDKDLISSYELLSLAVVQTTNGRIKDNHWPMWILVIWWKYECNDAACYDEKYISIVSTNWIRHHKHTETYGGHHGNEYMILWGLISADFEHFANWWIDIIWQSYLCYRDSPQTIKTI